jgi:hypothetical protein
MLYIGGGGGGGGGGDDEKGRPRARLRRSYSQWVKYR